MKNEFLINSDATPLEITDLWMIYEPILMHDGWIPQKIEPDAFWFRNRKVCMFLSPYKYIKYFGFISCKETKKFKTIICEKRHGKNLTLFYFNPLYYL